jgi:hypothetical protein
LNPPKGLAVAMTRCADQEQAHLQKLLAPVFVSEVAENQTSHWPCYKANGVNQQGADDTIKRVRRLRKEEVPEDEG